MVHCIHEESLSLGKSEGAARGSDHILPYQMRAQELRVMDHARRNHPKKLYPLVYMIALYHGKEAYGGPMSVAEKMDAPDAWLPPRWKEEMILVDLDVYEDSELLTMGRLGVFLMVLKHIYDSDMLETLKKLVPMMQELEGLDDGLEFLLTVFYYLYHASRIEKKDELERIAVESFSRETGGGVMTIAEQIREETRKESQEEINEAWAKAKQARQELLQAREEAAVARKKASETIARNMLAQGMEMNTISLCTNLSAAEIQKLR